MLITLSPTLPISKNEPVDELHPIVTITLPNDELGLAETLNCLVKPALMAWGYDQQSVDKMIRPEVHGKINHAAMLYATCKSCCPHWWELGKDGYVVECRCCGERKHRFTFTLWPLVLAAFPFWAQAAPSEEELAELVRKEREGCLLWQREDEAVKGGQMNV